jgi:hypothetical protein
MSAANLKIEWDEESSVHIVPLAILSQDELFSRTAGRPSQTRCPACRSIGYSRRHKLCGVCGRELPEACRFNESIANRIEVILRTEKARHRAWLRRFSAA